MEEYRNEDIVNLKKNVLGGTKHFEDPIPAPAWTQCHT